MNIGRRHTSPDHGEDICPSTGKVRYSSNKAATRAQIGLKRRRFARKSKSQNGKLQTFWCHECGDWHIGHAYGRQNTRSRFNSENRKYYQGLELKSMPTEEGSADDHQTDNDQRDDRQ